EKRRLLLVTQIIMGLTAATLATLTFTGVVQVWMVAVIALIFGTAQALDIPVRQSFVSEMVPPAQLSNALGLNSANLQTARILGPAVGGLLIVTVGTALCFLLNSLSFLAVIGGLLLMRTDELHHLPRVHDTKGRMREGLHYVWSTPTLRYAMAVM